jgi:hypothetical protein
MVCQLRPLVYSLGLNNPPRICLTPRKSRVKNVCRIKQGNCRCKMAGSGIRSFAKFCGQMPRIATSGITSWQVDCGLPRSALRLPGIHAVRPGLWQSALKFRLLTVAIRGLNAVDCHNPRHTFERGTEFQPPPFYIESPLFEASYLFAARLLEYKIPTQRIG